MDECGIIRYIMKCLAMHGVVYMHIRYNRFKWCNQMYIVLSDIHGKVRGMTLAYACQWYDYIIVSSNFHLSLIVILQSSFFFASAHHRNQWTSVRCQW